ncbi:MAG TPA: WecB/TagA/CpsF family glycosyltransferase [Chthoniobacterales bacterium]|jgi:exopolysaccharide biosynthesis WecB/TagA/CpsF family protein|nr:WecB/TagA/CpsF family glycosyltransferase [Chthoniobacterales bacterium]
MFASEQILGIKFFNGTVDEAVEEMSRSGGLLVVPAAPALVKICEDDDYRRALTSADMAIADSGAMVLLWKVRTGRSVERISGLKFLKRLVARLASHPDERVLWIVPSEHAHEKTIAWLRKMNLTGTADFYVAPRYEKQVRDPALVAKIDNHPPAHVVVGIGGGVQEKLGLFLKENLRARPAIHCIGAALAFLTGDQPPIPMWADRFYLGWFLRLLRQPRLYGPRYLSALQLPALIFKYRDKLPPLRG